MDLREEKEARAEYTEAIKEAIDFLENSDADSEAKFRMVKNICLGMTNDLNQVWERLDLLTECVTDLQKQ